MGIVKQSLCRIGGGLKISQNRIKLGQNWEGGFSLGNIQLANEPVKISAKAFNFNINFKFKSVQIEG